MASHIELLMLTANLNDQMKMKLDVECLRDMAAIIRIRKYNLYRIQASTGSLAQSVVDVIMWTQKMHQTSILYTLQCGS